MDHHKVNYLEMPAQDLEATKAFFEAVFGWQFQDWGESYASFADGRLNDHGAISPLPGPS